MALLFCSSFNNVTAVGQTGLALASVNGSPTIGVGDGPQGINTLHCNGASNGNFGWLPNVAITGSDGLIVGCGFNVTSFGSGFIMLYYIGSQTSLDGLVVAVNGDGSMSCFIVDGTNSFTSASGTFTFGNRHEVEIEVTQFNSSGTCTVYLDGVAIPALTGIAPANISGTILALNDGSTIHSVAFGGGLDGGAQSTPVVCDSVYAMDTSGSFCNAPVGPAISVPMIPNAPGQESSWTPNGASLGWECISEIPPDNDTTYISSSTVNQEEACELSQPSTISGVYGICVVSDQRQDTSGGGRTVELGLGNGTTRVYGTAWGLGTTYVTNTTPFSDNSFSTPRAWLLSDLSTLQVCAKLAS